MQLKSALGQLFTDRARLFTPVWASLLQSRWLGLLLGGIVALQVGLTAVGLPAWPCPVKTALGIPCPGCGLSRAIVLLLRGDWRGALALHAFAPIFLVGGGLALVISLLPEPLRQTSIWWVQTLEQRSGITAIFLAGLVVYWGLRLAGLL